MSSSEEQTAAVTPNLQRTLGAGSGAAACAATAQRHAHRGGSSTAEAHSHAGLQGCGAMPYITGARLQSLMSRPADQHMRKEGCWSGRPEQAHPAKPAYWLFVSRQTPEQFGLQAAGSACSRHCFVLRVGIRWIYCRDPCTLNPNVLHGFEDRAPGKVQDQNTCQAS